MDIEGIIVECAEGINPKHIQTKDENKQITHYCPVCSGDESCLYINKERLLEIRNEDNEDWKYSYMYECLRPFVKNMQKLGNGYRGDSQ